MAINAQTTLEVQAAAQINFAMQQNQIPFIQRLIIRHHGDHDLGLTRLDIAAEPPLILPFSQMIERISNRDALVMDAPAVQLRAEDLAALTERVLIRLQITLTDVSSSSSPAAAAGQVLASVSLPAELLAYDEWPGVGVFPELLAAFVTPNHPEIARLNTAASALLGKWTGNPSLDGYMSNDPNRIKKQIAAVYGALQAENIVYSLPPASFEQSGQRIRLCDSIIAQRLGTCLDLSLLYASCLEAMGLHPLLIIIKNHAFLGVWLEDTSFAEVVQDDVSALSKRASTGIDTMVLVETTAVTAGKTVSFDDAEAAGLAHLHRDADFLLAVDVHRARKGRIRPLPQRVRTTGGWVIQGESRAAGELTAAPSREVIQTTVGVADIPAPVARQAQWERKLLDLSLRNTLLNLRPTRHMIPLLAPSLGQLEDVLASGADFQALPRPGDWAPAVAGDNGFEFAGLMTQYGPLLADEFKNRRLRTFYSEGELATAMLALYRLAREAQEENGANTLYLALGLLKWYESAVSQKPRYAPLVLLPIDIVRRSALKGYVIRLRDEDPQMNITLLEMLRQDFGIIIEGLDPLPQDENGIHLPLVFATMRQGIMAQNRWDIVESAFLGIFSFAQFVMWNDLRNRSEDLLRNKIVSSLVAGRLTWTPEPIADDPDLESAVLTPIVADASQLNAIKAAGEGKSFVLHGPPGTGKSQTITNMIGNALAQGKTVLFVAEKMAALSVVHSRLQAMGLGPFCLELHSNKATKRSVLDQLKAATEVSRQMTALDFAERASQLASLRAELSVYVRALHQMRTCGLSLYDLVGRYEDRRAVPDQVTVVPDRVANLTAPGLQAWQEQLIALAGAGRACGHPAAHPLAGIRQDTYSQLIRMQAPAALATWQASLMPLGQAADDLVACLGLRRPASGRAAHGLAEICSTLLAWRELPPAWLQEADLIQAVNHVQLLIEHGRQAGQLRDQLQIRWQASFLAVSGPSLLGDWNQVSGQWFLPKAIGQGRISRQLKMHARMPIDKRTLASDLQQLCRYQQEYAALEQTAALCTRLLAASPDSPLYKGLDSDWDRLEKYARLVNSGQVRLLQEVGNEAQARQVRLACADIAIRNGPQTAYLQAWQDFASSFNALDALLRITPEILDSGDYLASCQERVTTWTANLDRLREWIAWQAVRKAAQAAGLDFAITAYEQGLTHDDLLPATEKALYFALILQVLQTEPALDAFSGLHHAERIGRFRALDQEFASLTRQEIFARLAARVPDFRLEAAQSSELGILQRAIRSGGRGISIRSLFDKIPGLLPRLCPCLLMSPISAAQYLDPDHQPFDLVIFDEASQMPTCKAVGVLARGQHAVIVGDPRQMPPTDFFATHAQDEENIEVEDLESILDDCLAMSIPDTHLLWHYRSRHESLIAFSNMQYYDNKLLTFPSANDQISKVRFVPVEGQYERGKSRQNPAEAQAVIAEVVRRLEDPATRGQSLGIVTFSAVQQLLIDDRLNELFARRPELEEIALQRSEPLFVKNLENVQGDERDVILFSVGYGPDQHGQVSLNFGPLNREGGWRRLNVAVSRARLEMLVFSTLQPDQINLARSSARGVAGLKAFLAYARDGSLPARPETQTLYKPETGGIGRQICDLLQAAGYATRRHVGRSDFRVDVGVLDPEQPDQYLLGILLDGPTYRNARSSRDREFAKVDILNGLGWQIHRIWTMDWWDNRDKEISRLLQVLTQIRQTVAQPPPPDAAGQPGVPAGRDPAQPLQPPPIPQIVPGSQTSQPPPIPQIVPGSQTSQPIVQNAPASQTSQVRPSPGTASGFHAQASLSPTSPVSPVPSGSADPAFSATSPVSARSADPASSVSPALASHPAATAFSGSQPEAPAPLSLSLAGLRYKPVNLPLTPLSPDEFINQPKAVLARCQQVIDGEAPIHEELLIRRVRLSFGISRQGSRIQSFLRTILAKVRCQTTRQAEALIYWRSDQIPGSYKLYRIGEREACHLPAAEVANALVAVLDAQFSMPKDDLLRETARLFDLQRMTAPVVAAMEDGLRDALNRKLIQDDPARNVITLSKWGS